MDQPINPHEDARPCRQIPQAVDPVAVLVSLLDAHERSVAQRLHACARGLWCRAAPFTGTRCGSKRRIGGSREPETATMSAPLTPRPR